MTRIFISAQDVHAGAVTITDKERLHYLKDVLRLKTGGKIIAVDENNAVYRATVKEIAKEGIMLRLEKEQASSGKQPGPSLTVACAIPKNARMDDIIDKLTQLGVDCIVPILTQRVIVRPDDHAARLRGQRWQKVALSAAAQSQRDSLPVVCGIMGFQEVIAGSADFDLKLIPVLIGERRVLNEVLGQKAYKNILVLIGPEGDFTPQELKTALAFGFIPVTLGNQVLRVDTAAVAVAAFIKLCRL